MTEGDDGWGEYRCRDEAVIPASRATVWSALSDLSAWAQWWTLVQITPLDSSTSTLLAPGVRFRFTGNRPGGATTRGWNIEVFEVVPQDRIELAYTDGDLVGRTAWELADAPGGTSVAYVYRGVRATTDDAAASFARFGLRLHNAAIQTDALAGLARFVRGEPLDDAWRAEVRRALSERLQA